MRKVLLILFCFILSACQQSNINNGPAYVTVPNEFDGQALNTDIPPQSSYDQYETIRKHIQIYSLTDEDIESLKKLFPEASNLHQLAKIACDTSQSEFYKNDHRALINAYSKTYREFILQPSNSNVLYDYLRLETKWIYSTLDHVLSPGSNLAWGWAYFAKACLVAYNKTKETRFLDLVMEGTKIAFLYTDDKIGKKDEFRQGDNVGWGISIANDPRWETEITLPGRIITPILEFAVLVKDDRFLQEKYPDLQSYVDRSIRILDYYIPEMKDNGENGKYFVNIRTQEHEAVNHQAAFVNACVYAYNLTHDSKYKNVVTNFYKYFKSIVTVDNDAYTWPYQILNDKSKIRTSIFLKESITVNMITDMNKYGFNLSTEEKQYFSNTFINLINRKFASVNVYISSIIDFPLTGYNMAMSDQIGSGCYTLWFPLSEYNPKVLQLIEDVVSTRTDIFPLGWFTSISDSIVYAYRLP